MLNADVTPARWASVWPACLHATLQTQWENVPILRRMFITRSERSAYVGKRRETFVNVKIICFVSNVRC